MDWSSPGANGRRRWNAPAWTKRSPWPPPFRVFRGSCLLVSGFGCGPAGRGLPPHPPDPLFPAPHDGPLGSNATTRSSRPMGNLLPFMRAFRRWTHYSDSRCRAGAGVSVRRFRL